MNIIYLNPRYLAMLKAYKHVDLTNAFSQDCIFELFNTIDLSRIFAETKDFISHAPLKCRHFLVPHVKFNSVLISHTMESETAPSSFADMCFSAMNDKSILAFDDCDNSEFTFVSAIDKVYTADEFIGSDIWKTLLSPY